MTNRELSTSQEEELDKVFFLISHFLLVLGSICALSGNRQKLKGVSSLQKEEKRQSSSRDGVRRSQKRLFVLLLLP